MKGITPVIAVILLLLITISLVGFAFIYFTRITETSTARVEESLQAQLNQQQKQLRIENANGQSVTIRNIGTAILASSDIAVFVNDALDTGCVFTGNTAPNEVKTCTLTSACASGSRVRVTAPGNSDTRTCS